MKLFNQKQLENIKMASKDNTRMALNGLLIEGNSTITTDGHRLMKVSYNPEPLPEKLLVKELGEEWASQEPVKKAYALEKHNEKMIEEWPSNGINWDSSNKPFILGRSTVEKALKNIPKKVDISILKNVAIGLEKGKKGDAIKAVCQTTDLENTDNVEARIVDGKFPNYKQVLPEFEDNPDYQRVSVNAKYLKEICTQLEKYNEGNHPVILYLKKDKLNCNIMDDSHPQWNPFLMPVIEPELGQNFSMGITANDGEGTDAVAVIMPLKI